jgi:hypothetical protein
VLEVLLREVSEENSASQAGVETPTTPSSSTQQSNNKYKYVSSALGLITPPALALGAGYLLAEYASLYMFTASVAGVAMGVGLLVGIALVTMTNLPKSLAEWLSSSEEPNIAVAH